MAFTPKIRNWRWYADDAAEPTTALANENTAPLVRTNTAIIRLRVQIHNIGDAQSTPGLYLQYSADSGSNWVTLGLDKLWNLANGKASAGNPITTYKLTGSDVKGKYFEGYTSQVLAVGKIVEIDWAMSPVSPMTLGSYLFRIYYSTPGDIVPEDGGYTYPSLTLEVPQGIGVTKENIYAVLDIPTGVVVSKENIYAVLDSNTLWTSIGASKAVVYSVIAPPRPAISASKAVVYSVIKNLHEIASSLDAVLLKPWQIASLDAKLVKIVGTDHCDTALFGGPFVVGDISTLGSCGIALFGGPPVLPALPSVLTERTIEADLDAILVTVNSETVSLNSYIQKTGITKSFDLDSYLKKQNVLASLGLDAYTCKQVLIISSLDSYAQKQALVENLSLDAYVKSSILGIVADFDAYLKKEEILKELGLDGYLLQTVLKALTIDAYVKKQELVNSLDIDSYLKKELLLMSFDLDAYLQRKDLLRSLGLDSYLAKIFNKEIAVDSYLTKTLTENLALDSYLQKSFQIIGELEAYLKKENIPITLDLDMLLIHAIYSSIDAILKNETGVQISLSMDGWIKQEAEIIYTNLDSYLKFEDAGAIYASIEAYLKQLAITVPTSIDAYLQEQNLLNTLSLDSYLAKGSVGETINLDSFLIRGLPPNSAILDAYLRDQHNLSVSTGIDAYLMAGSTMSSMFLVL